MKISRAEEYSEIKELREDYLDSIKDSQELYVEFLVDSGDYFLLQDKIGVTLGYFITFNQNVLVEFYLLKDYLANCESIFRAVVKRFSIKRVFCKSFDSILLKCCLDQFKEHKLIGLLFRDLYPVKSIQNSLKVREPRQEDLQVISSVKEGLFDDDREIQQYIQNRNMLIYEKGNKFIGCGIFQRINERQRFYDIGMLVHPEYRNKGFGAEIISSLTTFCHSNSWIPVCGCSVENIASRKTLEKAGFISKHNLIEFSNPSR